MRCASQRWGWPSSSSTEPTVQHPGQRVEAALAAYAAYAGLGCRGTSPASQPSLTALLLCPQVVMAEHFQLEVPLSCVLELDSSTSDKFSRHLLVRLPQQAWASNGHLGQLLAYMRTLPDFQQLMVAKEDGVGGWEVLLGCCAVLLWQSWLPTRALVLLH